MPKRSNSAKGNPFAGCTIVVTGKLEGFARNTIKDKVNSIDAAAGGSVTQKTDYLISMENQKNVLSVNQIYCMDCLELLSQLPDHSISLILTDPPYGIAYQNHFTSHEYPVLAGDSGIDYSRFARESFRVLKENSHAYFFTRFGCYPYHYYCLQQAGFAVKNCMIVEKGNIGGIGDLKGTYANNAEWLIFCQKGHRAFNHTTLLQNKAKAGSQFHKGRKPSKKYKTRFNSCWFGSEYPKATYNSGWQKQNGIYHPTIKNAEFLSWLIQISSHPQELVFDGFMGSGSTAVAALRTGRNYLGAEINSGYYRTATRRIKEVVNDGLQADCREGGICPDTKGE